MSLTPTSLKDLARDIKAQTGMKYTEALAQAKLDIHCPGLKVTKEVAEYSEMLSKLNYYNKEGKLFPWVLIYDRYTGFVVTVFDKDGCDGDEFVGPYICFSENAIDTEDGNKWKPYTNHDEVFKITDFSHRIGALEGIVEPFMDDINIEGFKTMYSWYYNENTGVTDSYVLDLSHISSNEDKIARIVEVVNR